MTFKLWKAKQAYLAASGKAGSRAQPNRMSVSALTLALMAGVCLEAYSDILKLRL